LVATTTSLLPFAALGLGHETADYLVGPTIDGMPMHVPDLMSWFTVLAVVLRLAVRCVAVLVAPGIRWARRTKAHRAGGGHRGFAPVPTEPPGSGPECASTAFYLWSTIAIPSVLFVTMTGVYFYHYYFALCPFLFVLVAVCMLPWRRVLVGLVVAQALIGYAFLSYVHRHGGISRGGYGISYARQVNR
jgi:hypothetical protein